MSSQDAACRHSQGTAHAVMPTAALPNLGPECASAKKCSWLTNIPAGTAATGAAGAGVPAAAPGPCQTAERVLSASTTPAELPGCLAAAGSAVLPALLDSPTLTGSEAAGCGLQQDTAQQRTSVDLRQGQLHLKAGVCAKHMQVRQQHMQNFCCLPSPQ